MNNDIAIKVETLTKTYKLYDSPAARLKEALHWRGKKYHKDFHALNDVSFEIKKGETVGIIGKNGSGKSTLLKIITGVLSPTRGKVTINGRISALLELGAGFNPEYTGMENIYFQGNLMGYSNEEMANKVDAIIEFADIGDFINQPVKSYSSGMFARLAFAVAINVDPDILIVDEALSVGDFAFQYKCFMKFKEFQSENKTVIFVTHSMQEVIRSCYRAIFIHEGSLIEDSYNVEQVVLNYETVLRDKDSSYYIEDKEINTDEHRFGTYDALITDICFGQKDGQDLLFIGEVTKITIEIECRKDLENLVLGYSLKNIKGVVIWGDNTLMEDNKYFSLKQGKHQLFIEFQANLTPSEYYFYVGLSSFIETKIDIDQRWRCKKVKFVSTREMAEGCIYAPSKVIINSID